MAHAISVQAYSFESVLSPKRIVACLPEGGTARLAKTQAVAQYGDVEFIIVYDFGAIVFVGVEDALRDRTVDGLLKLVGPEPHPPLQESLVIEIDSANKLSFEAGKVRARSLTRELAELSAFVVAQSAAMEYYEEDVDTILAKLNLESEGLAQTGKLRANVKSTSST
ncbi:MAG: RMD1 family protein [Polyangiaceae bacterium]